MAAVSAMAALANLANMLILFGVYVFNVYVSPLILLLSKILHFLIRVSFALVVFISKGVRITLLFAEAKVKHSKIYCNGIHI